MAAADGPERLTPAADLPVEPIEFARAVCPYLLVADGRWRSAAPARDHRCTAVSPPASLAVEKQRRLCLATEHATCATFLAAVGRGRASVGERAAEAGLATRWGYTRTSPVVFETRRFAAAMSGGSRRWATGQTALAGLLLVAFAAVAASRLSDAGGQAALIETPSPTPGSTPSPTATPRPSPATPTTTPTASTAATPSVVPTASPASQTYTVKSGDTLYAIAKRFNTTVAAIQEANRLGSSTVVRVGQILTIPSR